MTRCTACNQPINRSKEDYASSTKIKYVKAGRSGSRPTKESDTKFYHPNCKDKLTKEQLLDNWENGYFTEKADFEFEE